MVEETKDNPRLPLNNGSSMPMLGLGVYDMYSEEAVQAISLALQMGYRLLDTASMYGNEKEVGQAVGRSGIPRSEIFITTKVNNADQGFDSTLRAFDASLRKLGMDYVDLYLVHWPIRGKRKQTWQALEKIYSTGAARAIGVANYTVPFLEELASYAQVVPAVNQIEFTPYQYSEKLLAYCRQHAIQLQAYSPLIRGRKMQDPRLVSLSEKYKKTPAQILLRWDIELGISTIPKSVSKDRLRENLDIFDFSISAEDLQFMNGFHDNTRVADDPMNFW